MKTVSIICEYNPFHKGHQSHMLQSRRKVREYTGEDALILCVMSGNFVQRGDIAVMDKFARAEAAVRCGADLVIELPTPYAMAGAEKFACGAVELIDRMGIVDFLSFGSECGEIDRLQSAARILKSDELCVNVKEELRKGISFAAARQNAVERIDKSAAELLRDANNILAIEYLKALEALKSKIVPITVLRGGYEHDSKDGICSGRLRTLLMSGRTEEALSLMPEAAASVLHSQIGRGRAPVSVENIEISILSYLRRLTDADYFKLPDISEGLENKLYSAARDAVCLDDACRNAKSKRYSYSRIRRMYLSAYLDLTREISDEKVPYVRVLAFSDGGRQLIRAIDEHFPVITKPAAVKQMDERAQEMFRFEARCTDLYAMAYPGFDQRHASEDWTASPRYVKHMPQIP